MSTYADYAQYVSLIVAEYGVDSVLVPSGQESIFSEFGILVQVESGTELSEARVVEFYASSTLVARAKLP
jgi:hypothetical protein